MHIGYKLTGVVFKVTQHKMDTTQMKKKRFVPRKYHASIKNIYLSKMYEKSYTLNESVIFIVTSNVLCILKLKIELYQQCLLTDNSYQQCLLTYHLSTMTSDRYHLSTMSSDRYQLSTMSSERYQLSTIFWQIPPINNVFWQISPIKNVF
jgi:hypothetical protein